MTRAVAGRRIGGDIAQRCVFYTRAGGTEPASAAGRGESHRLIPFPLPRMITSGVRCEKREGYADAVAHQARHVARPHNDRCARHGFGGCRSPRHAKF
jgi:hypothetical protein